MQIAKILAVTLLSVGLLQTNAHAAATQVEGQAGGGIVPWAMISSGTPTVSTTWVDTADYTLSTIGVQAGILDRVELSYARLTLDPGEPHAGVGHVRMNSFGGKVKLLNMSDVLPAVSVGVQYKRIDPDGTLEGILDDMGSDDSGVDFYLAATKVLPLDSIPFMEGKKFLLNTTVRGTKANQIGLLGFGSDNDDSYTAQLEASAGLFLNKQTVFGLEYRMKPDNEQTCEATDTNCPAAFSWNENDWGDVFFAYFPNPNMAIVAAAALLGDLAPVPGGSPGEGGNGQRGLYFQIQGNF